MKEKTTKLTDTITDIHAQLKQREENHHQERMELLAALTLSKNKSDQARLAPGFLKVEREFKERFGKIEGLT